MVHDPPAPVHTPSPKNRLTQLGAVIRLARTPELREAAGVPEMYFRLSRFGAAGELSAAAVRNLAGHSISTVEELLAVDHVDRRLGTSFVEEMDISRHAVDALREEYAKTPIGADELQDWKRFDQYRYELGFDLQDTEEPAPVEHEMGASAEEAPPPGGVNLATVCSSGVHDQQNRGTCTAFASVACLEYHLCRTSRSAVRLSEQFQYWNMVEKTGRHSLAACFPLLQSDGVCRAATWPYWGNEIPGNDGQGPPPPAAVTEAAAWRCLEVLQLPPRSVQRVQQALRDDHLVAVGFPVYRSWFENPVVRKYGNITLPFPGEVPERVGHAVALVGFSDDADFAGGGYFILRNSWDHVWGTESVFGVGHGTLPYAYLERFNWDAWCITR